MGIRLTVLATTLAFLTASAASASTILYDFTDNLSDDSPTQTYTVAGEDLTIEASRRDNPGQAVNINRGNRGLGVSPQREGGRLGRDETLTFTVDSGRDITGLIVTLWERGSENEDFTFTVNGIDTIVTVLGGNTGQSTQTFDLSSLFSGATNTFSITAENSGVGNRGGRIGSVQVTLAPVPIPAGALFLATGLFGLGLKRRKTRL